MEGDAEADDEGTPGWVKASAVIVLVLLALFLLLHLMGSGLRGHAP